jgi:hypothetical protein
VPGCSGSIGIIYFREKNPGPFINLVNEDIGMSGLSVASLDVFANPILIHLTVSSTFAVDLRKGWYPGRSKNKRFWLWRELQVIASHNLPPNSAK